MSRLVTVFAALLGSALADFSLLLLHTNDMHARFQQTDTYGGLCEADNSKSCYGGFARLKEKVNSLKEQAAAKGMPTIFLNAGDNYQGTPYYTFFKWPLVAQFINFLGLDAMSLGNHEFDDGLAGLEPFMNNVTVPILCSNLNTTQEPSFTSPNLMKSIILNITGVKIGVIGYLTPDTKFLSSTGKLQILDEIASIRAEAKKLEKAGVKIIIGLGHSGYIKDQVIAREVPELDIVVGGHSHTFLYNGTQPDREKPSGPYPTMVRQPSGKMVPVVQAYYATKYLGYLELVFDNDLNLISFGGQPILLSGDLPQNETMLSALQPYENNITTIIHSVIGYTDVILDGSGLSCKLGECNMGNLITDAFVDYVVRHYHNPQGWTIAAVGLAQAGGIRGLIDTQHNEYHNGSILLGDVLIVVPWGSSVVLVNITGQTLLEALEFSVGRYEETVDGHVSEFLQVSGLQVEYNMDLTADRRVVSVRVLCADCLQPKYLSLNVTQTYGVVMPEYIAKGGDGFTMFANITDHIILDDVDYLVVAEYIKSHTPVYPKIEGRITVHKSTSPSSASSITTSWATLITISFVYILNSVIIS